MSEQAPNFQEAAAQDIQEINNLAQIPMENKFYSKDSGAISDGILTRSNVTHSLGTPYAERTMAQVSQRPVGASSQYEDIKAALSHSVQADGSTGTTAEVKAGAGHYIAAESFSEESSTHVNRAGYGIVEIKSPRAKELVGSLAAKAIKRALRPNETSPPDTETVPAAEAVSDTSKPRGIRAFFKR